MYDSTRIAQRQLSNRATHGAAAITIVLGVAQAFMAGSSLRSPSFGVGAGMAYLILCTFGMNYALRGDHRRAPIACLALAGLFASLMLFATNGYAWIAVLPLVSQALLFGSAWIAAFSSVAVVALLTTLFYVDHPAHVGGALVGVSTAMVFVLAFSLVVKREAEWRARAEEVRDRLRVANDDLTAYATKVAQVSAGQERARLAREIHDGLGHYLTAVHVQLEAAKALLDRDRKRAIEGLDKAQELARSGLGDMRASLGQWEASERDLSLPQALARFRTADDATLHVSVKTSGDERPLHSEQLHALFRTAQEGLTNVHRHASATRVEIRLTFECDRVRLEIADDGVGLSGRARPGSGLSGLEQRLRALGGRVSAGSSSLGGFSVVAEIPTVNPHVALIATT